MKPTIYSALLLLKLIEIDSIKAKYNIPEDDVTEIEEVIENTQENLVESRFPLGSNPIMESAVTDFPLLDSPTTPTISSEKTSKLRS